MRQSLADNASTERGRLLDISIIARLWTWKEIKAELDQLEARTFNPTVSGVALHEGTDKFDVGTIIFTIDSCAEFLLGHGHYLIYFLLTSNFTLLFYQTNSNHLSIRCYNHQKSNIYGGFDLDIQNKKGHLLALCPDIIDMPSKIAVFAVEWTIGTLRLTNCLDGVQSLDIIIGEESYITNLHNIFTVYNVLFTSVNNSQKVTHYNFLKCTKAQEIELGIGCRHGEFE